MRAKYAAQIRAGILRGRAEWVNGVFRPNPAITMLDFPLSLEEMAYQKNRTPTLLQTTQRT